MDAQSHELLLPKSGFERLSWSLLRAGNKARQFAGPLYKGYINTKGTSCQDRFAIDGAIPQVQDRNMPRRSQARPIAILGVVRMPLSLCLLLDASYYGLLPAGAFGTRP
jgi:hypothetical protein